jgi:hypothetical protein
MPGKGMSLLAKEELRNVPPIENIMNNDKDEISELLFLKTSFADS